MKQGKPDWSCIQKYAEILQEILKKTKKSGERYLKRKNQKERKNNFTLERPYH